MRRVALALAAGLCVVAGLACGRPLTTPAGPIGVPAARTGAGLVWDAARGELVMYGGRPHQFGTDPRFTDTWTFDGRSWRQRSPATSPTPGDVTLTAYDEAHGVVVAYVSSYVACAAASTWTWDGADWRRVTVDGPRPGPMSVMAYDPALRQVLLFGGSGCGASVAETWTWNGTAWTQLHPGGSTPPVAATGSLAWDGATRTMVFADDRPSLWRFDGRRWTPVAPVGPDVPPARDASALAGTGSGHWLLFGGARQGATGILGVNDTWTFDGRSWSQRRVRVAPPPRSGASAAYDPTRHRVVVFGGIAGGYGMASLNDTWTWDGTAWSMA